MKLIVMGAGYVGTALLTYLQSQPHEIFITTTQAERVEVLQSYGQHVFLLNPNEDEKFQELIHSCDGMVILVAPKNSQSYEETYLNTAKRVTSALKNRQKPFYILYTSSTSVCEGIQNEWVTEDRVLHPQSENAKILLETERHYLNCGAPTCILRLGGVYGPKREIIDRVKRFSGKEMPGSGEESTNHIHLEDIVAGIAFCLDRSLKGIYHLVNDDHRTRKEFYSAFCQQIDVPCPTWNSSISSNIKGGYKVSNQKIKEAGFIFKHPLTK